MPNEMGERMVNEILDGNIYTEIPKDRLKCICIRYGHLLCVAV